MRILVINTTDIKDVVVGTWIDELFENYMEICMKRISYQICFAKKKLKDKVNKINEDSHRLFDSVLEYMCKDKENEFTEYVDYTDYENLKVVILMNSAKTLHRWGESNDFIAVIKHISKPNLWHEMSHLFDVDDHYDEDGTRKTYCKDKNCVMAFGNETEVFCKYAEEEIRVYFEGNLDM